MLDDFRITDPSPLRTDIRQRYLMDEAEVVRQCIQRAGLSVDAREAISTRARQLVERIRKSSHGGGLMESFLNEYGLSNEEGIALMCLAEAMLRVPDAHTMDALIQDKLAPGNWQRHLGASDSAFVNASSWGLMLAGRLVTEDDAQLLGRIRGLVRKLGEPVLRTAVSTAMSLLGDQFVLGRSIDEALRRSQKKASRGYRYSYDMLGEAALTGADAQRHYRAYENGIDSIVRRCQHNSVADNPGLSAKLSALHPRYEVAKHARVMAELVPRVSALARRAAAANMGFNIDAEEADRLDLSLDVFEAVAGDPELASWDGLGIVVQSYLKRAPEVLDWLAALARRLDRRFMVRLVKGAYWDAEIKRHQELGLAGYPVYTRKDSTDVCFLACARMLLDNLDVFYPQFATHNAHSVAAVLEMAGSRTDYEFQRLQGMGEALHDWIVRETPVTSRIYAPVGIHRDLLAYLVRRLLENGANSSFVNQLVDERVPVEALCADPIAEVEKLASIPHERIPLPPQLYGAFRHNARGINLADPLVLEHLQQALVPFAGKRWEAAPLIAGEPQSGPARAVLNPADHNDRVGNVVDASPGQVELAMTRALAAQPGWQARSPAERGECLRRAADQLEAHTAELIALCVREAGKSYLDAVAEIREAVDFLRYYPVEAERLARDNPREALGVFVCVSPWNFPLAIFSGQIAAALVMGNAVLAKPAEQTSLIACRAVQLFHEAGVPGEVLQLLPGDGESVGARLVSDPRISGVAFTGSTAVARLIRRSLVDSGNGRAALIAETGGLNAMIVDSTALPEQAVKDIVASSFQSAGQRCSALRLLYVQEDIADALLEMLAGAMAELRVDDPALLSTDVGPVIDAEARANIQRHLDSLRGKARLIQEVAPAHPERGNFVAPTAFELDRPERLREEIFGPVLHVVRYRARDLGRVVDAINDCGYGLTFGIHSRINSTVERVSRRVKVGNVYVNRNQIGAVVGVQPFGGERLSGTGPKAGGPHYLLAFSGTARALPALNGAPPQHLNVTAEARQTRRLQEAWDSRRDRHTALAGAAEKLAGDPANGAIAGEVSAAAGWARELCDKPLNLPGPTGEQNQLSRHGRGVVLCLGDASGQPGAVIRQIAWALAAGNGVIAPLDDAARQCFVQAGVPAALIQLLPPSVDAGIGADSELRGVDAVMAEAAPESLQGLYRAAAVVDGPIIQVIDGPDRYFRLVTERTESINTTAAGGNASLLAMVG